jgi:DNA (cytosine-5)-methyltransferase 3A
MRVLSLFDGISCARVALTQAGVRVGAYYASEVDPKAIQIAMKNYPDTIQLGDIRELRTPPNSIDLLIGGSPCQDLSIAKKNREGLQGSRSSLFWEYIRIFRTVKPRWFILENVASMSEEDRNIITAEMGVEPVMFNASLVSAQSRKRLFWTNIPFILPPDRGILLKDILQPDEEVDESMTVNSKSFYPSPNEGQKQRTTVKLGYIGEGEQYGQGGQAHSVYDANGKTPTLSSFDPLVSIGRDVGRRLNAEGHREDYNKDIPIQRQLELRTDDKSGTLTSVLKDNLVVGETRIRKLTPIECERLQGLPDNYTEGIAKTHRYKCLGNGFCVPVIAHILGNLRP